VPPHVSVAFVNVNVAPMDGERVLADQTVNVRKGRIAQVGRALKMKVPKDAVRIHRRLDEVASSYRTTNQN
jgi:hypothetical protein